MDKVGARLKTYIEESEWLDFTLYCIMLKCSVHYAIEEKMKLM